MSLNFREIRDEARSRLKTVQGYSNLEYAPGEIEQTVTLAYEQVYNHVVRLNSNHFRKSALISWKANQQEYPLPPDCIRVDQVEYVASGVSPRRLRQGVRFNKRSASARYPYPAGQTVSLSGDDATGVPFEWYPDGRYIGFRLVPGSDTDNAARIEYVPRASSPSFADAIFDTESGSSAASSGGAASSSAVEEPNLSTDWWTAAGTNFGVGAVPGDEYRWRMMADTFQVTDAGSGITYSEYSSVTNRIERDKVLRGSAALTFEGVSQTLARGPASRLAGFEWGNTSGTGPAMNLGADPDDYIIISLYIWDIRNVQGTNPGFFISFYSSSGNSYASPSLSIGTDVVFVSGWNHIAIKRSKVTVNQGSPNWASIVYALIRVSGDEADLATKTIKLTLDGFSVINAHGLISGNYSNVTNSATLKALGLFSDNKAPVLRPEEEDLSEWIVLEACRRLAGIVISEGRAISLAAHFESLLKDVRSNALALLGIRSIQQMPRIGEVR